VIDGRGASRLEALVLRDRSSGDVETEPAGALFVLIGAQPHTAWLPPGVARDQWGFVLTGNDVPSDRSSPGRARLPFETSLRGVFAIGDVRHDSVKRVASAVGEGSVVVGQVHRHLSALGPTLDAGGEARRPAPTCFHPGEGSRPGAPGGAG
jgi:thioredoxin reductase (NADPH)